MQFEVEIGGRIRQVMVTRSGAGFAVSVDGHTRHVDAVRIGAHRLSLVLDRVWSKDAVVATDPATRRLTVHVDGTRVAVGLNGRRHSGRSPQGAGGAGRPDSLHRVTAPMPGKVVRVLVKPGEAVRNRQPLVVVEAMKMENELRAGRDGLVADVLAREGQLVDAGALLIVIQ